MSSNFEMELDNDPVKQKQHEPSTASTNPNQNPTHSSSKNPNTKAAPELSVNMNSNQLYNGMSMNMDFDNSSNKQPNSNTNTNFNSNSHSLQIQLTLHGDENGDPANSSENSSNKKKNSNNENPFMKSSTTTTNTNTSANSTKQSNTEPIHESKESKSVDTFDVDIVEEDYEAIAVMIDELLKDDPAVRIKAIRSLPVISKALGYERTRNELIPYITQMIDDDDEVLLVLIEEIYRLMTLNLIGNKSEYYHCLIPPFERLCQVEEKIIRDEACKKFATILHSMPYKTNTTYFSRHVLPLFERLCKNDWHTARISGASLIASAFSRFVQELDDVEAQYTEKKQSSLKPEPTREDSMDVDSDDKMKFGVLNDETYKQFLGYKQEMLQFVRELCEDNIPIVRRSAIITLGKMVKVLKDEDEVIKEYLPLFLTFSSDEQDNVRVFAVETLLQFSHIFTPEQVKKHLLHPIRQLVLDSAWRVRYIAADNFINLCKMLDAFTINNSMINYFLRLLSDQEPEVRAVAISKIPGISKLIGVQLSIEKLIPIIKDNLVSDSNKYARASLASIIIPFCYQLPHQIVIDHILECILKILKDEYPNVRLHVISNICDESTPEPESESKSATETGTDAILSKDMKKFNISLLEESIIPSIIELTLDNDWRVRLGIVEKFPALAKQFGLDFFNQKLFDICLASLEDNVADIRLSAASNLFIIANAFDVQTQHDNKLNSNFKLKFEWAHTKLIPELIKKMHSSRHYLHRIVYLLAFQYLSEGLGTGTNDLLILEILNTLQNDSVPNVRFKACQVVQFLATKKIIHSKHFDSISNKLHTLIKNDVDKDVKYYAKQCYQVVASL